MKTPASSVLSASARLRCGKMSATSEWPHGLATASPTPTPSRAAPSTANELAAPPSAVIVDHSARPKAITFLRGSMSEIRPMAMPTTE